MKKEKNFFNFMEGDENEIIHETPIEDLKNELKEDGIDVDALVQNIKKEIQKNEFYLLRKKAEMITGQIKSSVERAVLDRKQIIFEIQQYLFTLPTERRVAFSAHHRNLDEESEMDLLSLLSQLKSLNEIDWNKNV